MVLVALWMELVATSLIWLGDSADCKLIFNARSTRCYVRAKERGVRVGLLKTCAAKNKILQIIWVDLELKRTRFCFRFFILQCKEWVFEKAKPKLRIDLYIIYIHTMGS